MNEEIKALGQLILLLFILKTALDIIFLRCGDCICNQNKGDENDG